LTRSRSRSPASTARRAIPLGSGPLLVFLAAATVALFVYFAHEALLGDQLSFDRAILLALRRPADLHTPIGPAWLRQSAIDISALGGFTVLWLLSAALIGFLIRIGRGRDAALLAGSVIGASLLNAVIKHLVHRPRPFVVPHLAEVSNASFPSGHATLSAVAYFTMAALLVRTRHDLGTRLYILLLAIVLVVMVGVSRIYLGVHWPSDVLGGWCFGSAWGIGFWFFAAWLDRLTPGAAASDDRAAGGQAG
jgi:undecaprenyl-diphosphatase